MFNPFRLVSAFFTLRLAIIKADAEYHRTGNRHYVIPSTTSRKLIVTSSIQEVHNQGLRHSKDFHRPDYTNPHTLMSQAFYYTESSKTRNRWKKGMPRNVKELRRRMFYRWFCER